MVRAGCNRRAEEWGITPIGSFNRVPEIPKVRFREGPSRGGREDAGAEEMGAWVMRDRQCCGDGMTPQKRKRSDPVKVEAGAFEPEEDVDEELLEWEVRQHPSRTHRKPPLGGTLLAHGRYSEAHPKRTSNLLAIHPPAVVWCVVHSRVFYNNNPFIIAMSSPWFGAMVRKSAGQKYRSEPWSESKVESDPFHHTAPGGLRARLCQCHLQDWPEVVLAQGR
jgi:hypothetical protein